MSTVPADAIAHAAPAPVPADAASVAPAATIRGADALLRALEHQGVDLVFGYPGGAIMPVYDALVDSKIRHILVRHEQGAALAANGYARHTGKVGVCIATSGPGATNLVTGIADAFLDSVPMVAITGQVATSLMGTDAFQEVDIFGITLPIVKHSYIVRDAQEIPRIVAEAFRIAREGRPGPVLIDLPKDVANARVACPHPGLPPQAGEGASEAPHFPSPQARERASEAPHFSSPQAHEGASEAPHFPSPQAREGASEAPHFPFPRSRGKAGMGAAPQLDRASIQRARTLIAASRRPVFYTGYGVGLARAEAALRKLVRDTGIPVVSTLKGLGALPTDHPQFLGMLGMHGSKAANFAVQESDLLIVAGARFDDRATGKLAEFAPQAKVIHLDTDAAEVSKLRYAQVHIVGELNAILPQLDCRPDIGAWQTRCETLRREAQPRYDAPGEDIYAPALLRRLSEIAPADTTVVCDVGQHQMWVAQHWIHRAIHRHLTSGGLGTMGFGLPAALGVKLGHPETTVVCVSGDGSIMMNIQELATLRRYGVAVKIVLLDNSALGMVRQWQELFFAERYSEIDLSDNPDFAQVARAFGIGASTIERREQIDAALHALLAAEGPHLLHVKIDPRANVWPLVPPNSPNHQMMEKTP